MRRIAVVTGTRAEYGLLYWIIKQIHEDPGLELQLIVTGSHLSRKFGMTAEVIEKDGFPIAERVEMPLSSDSEEGIATSMGVGMVGFAKAYARLKPDLLLVLGDRFEIHAAVSASVPFRIPVAHIHGGESSEGAIDEVFRHSITKMSHLHFPSTEKYAKRIVQMGENPERVFCFGAPGLDNIDLLPLLDRNALGKELGIPAEKGLGVITYHPVTLSDTDGKSEMDTLLSAARELASEEGIFWIITLPNADSGNGVIIDKIAAFVRENPSMAKAFASLGQLRYLSLLRNAEVMLGNSSSGIIEAPSFRLPVVNVGERQQGRIKAGNVIDVPAGNARSIKEAVAKGLSDGFRQTLSSMENPYYKGNASKRIADVLKNVRIDADLLKKRFID